MKCVEEASREISDKAAAIEFLSKCAAETDRLPDSHVFSGIGDISGEIAVLAAQIRRVLDLKALNRRLRGRRFTTDL